MLDAGCVIAINLDGGGSTTFVAKQEGQAQAPSVTTFDYAHASREQREALKRQIREAAARGEKIYPGK